MMKNLPVNAGDEGSTLGLGFSPEKEMATHSRIHPGKSHGQRSLVGYSPWGSKRVRHDQPLNNSMLQTLTVWPLLAS